MKKKNKNKSSFNESPIYFVFCGVVFLYLIISRYIDSFIVLILAIILFFTVAYFMKNHNTNDQLKKENTSLLCDKCGEELIVSHGVFSTRIVCPSCSKNTKNTVLNDSAQAEQLYTEPEKENDNDTY